MKVAILTQPLYFNYGGILQAFALYSAIQKLGHEVWIVNRVDPYTHGRIYRTLSAYKALGKECIYLLTGKKKYEEFKNDLFDSTLRTFTFVSENIPNRSKELHSDKELKFFTKKMKFDAYVVGSDQVWRPVYSPNIYNYFLDFVEDKSKKISYAASFGVDEWEFSDEETKTCSKLLQKFDAVSIRETSGIGLCAKHLRRMDARFVLDPTLLHTADFYRALIDKKVFAQTNEYFLLSYILDPSAEKYDLLSNISCILGLPLYEAQKGLTENKKNHHVHGKASIEEWLYGFAYAQFAVVDSFHGCVFSLIFHVPFIVIVNNERGATRFHSLLSLFGLESRLLSSTDDFYNSMLQYEFPWDFIDSKLEEMRKQSYDFLSEYLK